MDYGIVQFTDQLSYSSARLVSASPRVIELNGADFSTARAVFVNGDECPRVEVVSRGQLLAELPASVTTRVDSISVVSTGPTRTAESTSVSLGALSRPAVITGMSALVQRVLKVLLTTPGSDVIGGGAGGGVLSLLGTLSAEQGTLAAEVSAAMQSVSDYLISDPAQARLPRAEQFGALNLLSVEWDREAQRVSLAIEIINGLGEKSVSQFGA